MSKLSEEEQKELRSIYNFLQHIGFIEEVKFLKNLIEKYNMKIYTYEHNYINKDNIKELAQKYEYASYNYDSSTADYKHSQDIGKYMACIELLKEGE